MLMAKNSIEVKNLVKEYGDNRVVDGISFSVKEGEVFGILGPNGVGKTTTLEMMETMLPIDGGSVSILGIDVSKKPRDVKFLIGVQTQHPAFMEKVTLIEQIEQMASAYGIRPDANALLSDVGLVSKADEFVEDLSGGQRQRFSVAVALAHNPKVLFMDEPTTGLDPQARHNMWEMIVKIKKRGVTVVLTTHYMEEAEELCDRVAIMDQGKIVAIDTPEQLIKSLLSSGFKKRQQVEKANLEDVVLMLTGRYLRD